MDAAAFTKQHNRHHRGQDHSQFERAWHYDHAATVKDPVCGMTVAPGTGSPSWSTTA